VTTGTPIALVIDNVDQRSKDYSDIKDKYRPGTPTTPTTPNTASATIAAAAASPRARPPRGCAGAIARQDRAGMTVRARSSRWASTGSIARAGTGTRSSAIRSSAPMLRSESSSRSYLDDIRKARLVRGRRHRGGREACPRASARRSTASSTAISPQALMGINAVKGVEIGAGFAAAALSGEENADEMRMGNDGRLVFLSNHAGGVWAAFRPASRSCAVLWSSRPRRS
jgi:chorismate synthase